MINGPMKQPQPNHTPVSSTPISPDRCANKAHCFSSALGIPAIGGGGVGVSFGGTLMARSCWHTADTLRAPATVVKHYLRSTCAASLAGHRHFVDEDGTRENMRTRIDVRTDGHDTREHVTQI